MKDINIQQDKEAMQAYTADETRYLSYVDSNFEKYSTIVAPNYYSK